ncbi:MAG: xanthine dehydrogenase accessory protein XdhC [Rhodobacteraceae bacterium HLUCCO07]|nr:MAG: xanthine dehydrogenase accessory protein XdhC [Rhodobacteraceae bacterium HLUCCO07]
MSGLARFLDDPGGVVHVKVARLEGSGPREAGTGMFVSRKAQHGTIGGGQLEYMAIDHARRMLADGQDKTEMQVTLGPESGQCCGGRVWLELARLDRTSRVRVIEAEARDREADPQVMIFGAGHVGRALARVLADLPVQTVLVDTRADELSRVDTACDKRLVALPEAEIDGLRPGAAAVIVTHDHALDFLIAAEALKRPGLAYVGMIGSKTKRASFSGWVRRNGVRVDGQRLTCPMAAEQKGDKRPEVIAVQIAAEVMSRLGQYQSIRESMERQE